MNGSWYPPIDKWIFETTNANINQTTRDVTSYQFAPTQTDIYKSEAEEKKHVDGFGDMSIKEMQGKIVNILSDLVTKAKSNEIRDIERLEHIICNSAELSNLIRQYIKHTKDTQHKS